ncbi:MAG: hypothetical protein HZA13_06550 [Nitrospirae bacterium]|nr:hypothetical protein [Nitrospirota bacterium]
MNQTRFSVVALWIAWIVIGFSVETDAKMTLTPSLSVSERHNDNLFFTETNKDGDSSTSVIPSATLTYEGNYITLSGRYQGRAEYFSSHPDLNGYSQDASLDLNLSHIATGLDIRITESVTYSSELPAFSFNEQPQETNEGIQVPRTDTIRNRAGATISYIWTPRFSTALSYSNLIVGYPTRPDLQEPIVHDLSLRIGYKLSPSTQWNLTYGLSITDFQTDRNAVSDVIIHRATIGVGHQFNSTLSVNGNVGMAHEILTFPSEDESTSAIFDVNFSRDYSSGRFTLGYSNSVGTGSGQTSTVTLSQRAFFRATETLDRYISVFAQMGFGRNTSIPDKKELFIFSYEVNTGVNLMIFSWLNSALSYSYFFQESKGSTGDSGERNIIMLTLTATAPEWKIMR